MAAVVNTTESHLGQLLKSAADIQDETLEYTNTEVMVWLTNDINSFFVYFSLVTCAKNNNYFPTNGFKMSKIFSSIFTIQMNSSKLATHSID